MGPTKKKDKTLNEWEEELTSVEERECPGREFDFFLIFYLFKSSFSDLRKFDHRISSG